MLIPRPSAPMQVPRVPIAVYFLLSAACNTGSEPAQRQQPIASGRAAQAAVGGQSADHSSPLAGMSGAAAGSSTPPRAAAAGGGRSGSAAAFASAAGSGGFASGGRSSAGTAAQPLVTAGNSAAAGSGAAIATAKLVPAHGALLGEYYGDGTVAETDMRLGRKPAVHLTYVAWKDDWTRIAASDLAADRIPLVNWEPAGIDFNDIASGSLDGTINARAAGAKALAKPFFLDFAAEMNGDEAWSGNDAKLYVTAYRHIHDLFVAAGATNVVWAWCPNVTDVDGSNKHTLDYYPGDDYVDWTGVDGYNWGSGNGFRWQSFQDVFARIYPVLASKGKPILIGEMASDEAGGDKAAWIDAIIPSLQRDYPLIKGLVWFDVHKERSWQINSSPASLAAYMRFAHDPYMNP